MISTHNGRIQWLESNWKEVFIFPIYRAHNNSSNGTNFLIKTRWCFGSAFCISIWHGTLHSAAHRVIIHDFLRGKPFSRLRNFTYKHRFLSSLKWCSRAYIQRWSFLRLCLKISSPGFSTQRQKVNRLGMLDCSDRILLQEDKKLNRMLSTRWVPFLMISSATQDKNSWLHANGFSLTLKHWSSFVF